MINIYSKNVLIHRERRKIIALKAVLEAQRRIGQYISEDPEKEYKIACVSHQFSSWSRTLARRVGYHSAMSDP